MAGVSEEMQAWLHSLDDVSATHVLCQTLQLKPGIIPSVIEYSGAVIAAAVQDPADAIRNAEMLQGRYVGIIKSFNDEKGYGFVYCAEIQQLHSCDSFLHQNQRMGLPVGAEVSFEITLSDKGGRARRHPTPHR